MRIIIAILTSNNSELLVMKTIFDKTVREEVISRINALDENSAPQWGKMNGYQMLSHCVIWSEWILGTYKPEYKQAFIGLIFGKIGLRRMIKDEKPFDKNVPTSAGFKVKETHGDAEVLKQRWISLTEDFENYSNPDFIHDFFGKMTKEQIGILVYKHSDHHLRQFNA